LSKNRSPQNESEGELKQFTSESGPVASKCSLRKDAEIGPKLRGANLLVECEIVVKMLHKNARILDKIAADM